jgi:CBS domain-containing protein
LLVTDDSDRLVGIVTKTDILRSFQNGGRHVPNALHAPE